MNYNHTLIITHTLSHTKLAIAHERWRTKYGDSRKGTACCFEVGPQTVGERCDVLQAAKALGSVLDAGGASGGTAPLPSE